MNTTMLIGAVTFLRPWILALVSILYTASAARAGVNMWSGIGPNGGRVTAMAHDPAVRSTLYAVTVGGFYRSLDSGAIWEKVSVSSNSPPTSVAVDSQAPGRVYLLLDNGSVLGSTDSGATFRVLRTSNTSASQNAIQIATANNGSTIYFGAGGNMYRSTDAGNTWSLRGVVTGVGSSGYLYDLQVDASNPDVVYTATFGSGLFKSIDGGSSWQSIYAPVTTPFFSGVWGFAIDPSNSQKMFVHTDRELLVSVDGGASWQSTVIQTNLTDMVISKANPQMIFATQWDGNVQRSSDGGATWTLLTPPGAASFRFGIAHLLTDATDGNQVYLYGGGHLLSSSNAGASWQLADRNISTSRPYEFHSTQTGRILVPVDGLGLYDIAPDGKSIGGIVAPSLSFIRGIDPPDVIQVLSFPASQERLLVRFNNGTIARTENPGGPWLGPTGIPNSASVSRVAVSLRGAHNAFAATHSGIYRSTDYGETWTRSDSGIPAGYSVDSVATTIDPNLVFAAAGGALSGGTVIYKSIDAGLNWTATPLVRSAFVEFDVSPFDSQTVFARTSSTYDKSTDGGATWNPAGFVRNGFCCLSRVFFDPTNASILYGIDVQNVFRSVDGGQTFRNMNSINTFMSAQSLFVNPSRPSQIFAAVNGFGVMEIEIAPDIELIYASTAAALPPNSTWTFAITVRNNNSLLDATNVRLEAQMSGSFANLAASIQTGGACTASATAATCTLPTLNSGSSTTIQFTVTATTAGTIRVVAQSSSDYADPVSTNNVVDRTMTVESLNTTGGGGGGGGALNMNALLALLFMASTTLVIAKRRERPH